MVPVLKHMLRFPRIDPVLTGCIQYRDREVAGFLQLRASFLRCIWDAEVDIMHLHKRRSRGHKSGRRCESYPKAFPVRHTGATGEEKL